MLWKKVMSGLSAGRVQSVATRLVVDRERERMAFRAASYWDLEGDLRRRCQARPADVPRAAALRRRRARRDTAATSAPTALLKARSSTDGTGVAPRPVPRRGAGRGAAGPAFDGPLGRGQALPPLAVRAVPHHDAAAGGLPQARLRRLADDAGGAAAVRERLHHLHAHRLDHAVRAPRSTRPGSRSASCTARSTCPTRPRTYASKVKNAQEAHEAIRPAGDAFRTPGADRPHGDEFRLYELIWMRTVASQMKDAVGQSVSVRIGGAAATGEDVRVRRQRPGDHLPRLPQGLRRGRATTPTPRPTTARPGCPTSSRATRCRRPRSTPSGHETKPPARYTEATLIKELEEREIGRPSTYASIIGTILNRGYVYKKGTALVPAWLAFASSGCSRSTSRGRSTTSSPPAWRTCSTRSPAGRERPQHRARRVLLRLRRRRRPARSWSTSSARSTPRSWPRSPSAGPTAGSSCASAGTARTSRARRRRRRRPASAPTCPTTCRPTS